MNVTAFKIAIREARASRGKFLFVILAVALGVGALTGVRGFSSSFTNVLLKEARSLMAADLSVRLFAEPTAEQQAAIESLAKRGAIYTRVTETASMVAPREGDQVPVLVSLKAVDPALFPFYGTLTMDPAGSLRERLSSNAAVISDDLRIRLGVKTGDMLRVGLQDFRIAGILTAEPDRMSGSLNVGPRVMISREALNRTGLIGLGSRASQRILFKLNPGAPPVSSVHDALRKAFPEALIVDFRELNPNIARGLDRATTFLSLVSLIALIVGAIGVGTSMHAHLQQKMDSIAIMKSIGGRSNQIVRIYVAQTLLLGIAGGAAGVVMGLAVQRIFPLFLQRYFQIQPELTFSVVPALQGMIIGVLTTLLFTLPPLLGVRRISPALIFRRDMPEMKAGWRTRLRGAGPSILAGFLICLCLAGIAGWLTGGPLDQAIRMGGTFIAGLLVSLLLLWAVAALLLVGLKKVIQRNRRLPIMLRHAIANLYRPGSQATAILTALGIGVMFTLTVYLVQHSVIREIARTTPPGMPNVFFLDVSPAQRDQLAALVRGHKGVSSGPEVMPTVSSRLVAVNGVPVDEMSRGRRMRRYRMARAITTSAAIPSQTEIVKGKWWDGTPQEPLISVTPNAAEALDIQPGAVLTWNAFGKTFDTKVAVIHRNTTNNLRSMVEFIASPGVIDELPTIYYAAARIDPSTIGELQRLSYRQFPTVTVINIADVLERAQEIVDQISAVIRFISAFAILAGAIILASSIAGTRFRRVREVVIFKSLGATRARIAAMFSAEFLILGTVAGLMGTGLAVAFSTLILSRFFDAPFRFDVVPNAVSVLATALTAAASGWLASFRILGQKPLEVLRGE